jgi:hypothetical protein
MMAKKQFIAFSGGVESTTMCLLYGAVAQPIFADTGWEHQAMYDRLDDVEEKLRAIHGDDFHVLRVKSDTGTLQGYIERQKFVPSFRARFCTRMFKIEPIDAFLRQYEDEGAELLIGLNAEEGDRTGNHGLLPFVEYRYPLLDAGYTRGKCRELLQRFDLYPVFPPYMQRGGCVGCFFKSKREFAAMAHLAPDEAYGVADLEDAVQDVREDHYGVRDGIPHMRAFLDNARASLFTGEEMYTADTIHTSCGVFCHR